MRWDPCNVSSEEIVNRLATRIPEIAERSHWRRGSAKNLRLTSALVDSKCPASWANWHIAHVHACARSATAQSRQRIPQESNNPAAVAHKPV